DIQHVGLQTTQTPLDARTDGSGREIVVRLAVLKRFANLGGEREFVTTMTDCPADSLFAQSICRSGGDVVDPQVENPVEQIHDRPIVRESVRLAVLGLLIPSDFEGAEPDRRHRKTGLPEGSSCHLQEFNCWSAGFSCPARRDLTVMDSCYE